MSNVVVISAGLSGLSAACYLTPATVMRSHSWHATQFQVVARTSWVGAFTGPFGRPDPTWRFRTPVQSGKRFRDPRLHELFSFQAMFRGLHAGCRARALCRNHIHGQHCRRLVPRRRHPQRSVAMAQAAEKAGDLTVHAMSLKRAVLPYRTGGGRRHCGRTRSHHVEKYPEG